MVRASYTNDLRDLKKLCAFHLFVARGPQTFAVSAMFALIAVFFFVMSAVGGNAALGCTAGAVLLAAAAILPLIRFFLQSAKMKKAAASNPNYTATLQEYTFGEENFTLRICVRGKEEEYAIPYAQVLRAYETKEYFYLYIGGGKVLILPKGAITEGSADELAACLRAMGKRFREKRSCRRA